jgi:S-adenosylmethionine hydrolase
MAALRRLAPTVDVINLSTDAPAHDVNASSYLFPNHANEFPAGAVFLRRVAPVFGGPRVLGVLWVDGMWNPGSL